jgi:hypothetical protein
LDDEDRKWLDGYQQVSSKIGQTFQRYRKSITGAQASFQELEQLEKIIVNMNMGPTRAARALRDMKAALKRGLEIKKEILSTGQFEIDSPEYAQALEARKGEILGAISNETLGQIGAAVDAADDEWEAVQ